jgi:hypothetical protein
MIIENPCIACGKKKRAMIGALTLSDGSLICGECAATWCEEYHSVAGRIEGLEDDLRFANGLLFDLCFKVRGVIEAYLKYDEKKRERLVMKYLKKTMDYIDREPLK